MASVPQKITDFTEITVADSTDILVIVDDISGVPVTRKISVGNFNALNVQLAGAQTITGDKIFSSSLRVTGTLLDSSGDPGTSGQVLSSTVTGTDWINAGAGGDVTKVGTPVDNQLGVWTGDGTIEGVTALTFDGSTLAVTGAITATSFSGITSANLLDKTAAENISQDWNWLDNVGIQLGSGADGRLYYSTGTDDVRLDMIGTTDFVVRLNATELGLRVLSNGAFEAYFDNTLRLATTNTGVAVTGDISLTGDIVAGSVGGIAVANLVDSTAAESISNDWNWIDNVGIQLGSGVDGRLYFSSATDDIRLDLIGGTDFVLRLNATELAIQAIANGAVELYHNNALKLVTAADGIDITGDVGGTTIGGITEANLLDKIAAETISGAYTFTSEIAVGSYIQVHLVTSTQLNDITDTINTDPGKIAGSMLWNDTTRNPVYSIGAADGSVWVDGAGTTVNTPV